MCLACLGAGWRAKGRLAHGSRKVGAGLASDSRELVELLQLDRCLGWSDEGFYWTGECRQQRDLTEKGQSKEKREEIRGERKKVKNI